MSSTFDKDFPCENFWPKVCRKHLIRTELKMIFRTESAWAFIDERFWTNVGPKIFILVGLNRIYFILTRNFKISNLKVEI